MLAVHSSLESLANSSEKEIQTVDEFAANATVLTECREPGIMFSPENNTISSALEGTSGAYVVYVNSIVEPTESTR